MKLDYKRTIFVGFAFFLISAFWQAYDATIPVILTNKFYRQEGSPPGSSHEFRREVHYSLLGKEVPETV